MNHDDEKRENGLSELVGVFSRPLLVMPGYTDRKSQKIFRIKLR
jgi:hypothetical protein